MYLAILLIMILVGKIMSPLFIIAIRNTNLSTDQWKDDILFLKEELMSRHIDIFANISEEEYNSTFDKLLEDLPRLKSDEIVVRLLENIALIGDSHTKILNYNIGTDLIYPIELCKFKDGYYVVKVSENNDEIIGSKLVAINDVKIENIEEKISKLIPHENRYWMYKIMPSFIRDPRILQHFNIVNNNQADFSFIDTDGKLFKVKLQTNKANAIEFVQIDQVESEMNSISDEYTFFEKEEAFYIDIFKDKQLTYDINAILNKEQYTNVKSLIIDLRNHSGGMFIPKSKLVNSIKEYNMVNKKGQVFVIIGRNTYSSGILLALDIKKNTNAIFYGEPTGGKPDHFGDIRNIKLPNSKIVVTYSTKHFKSDESTSDALYPDVEVDLTIEDVLKGIDPVVRKILDINA